MRRIVAALALLWAGQVQAQWLPGSIIRNNFFEGDLSNGWHAAALVRTGWAEDGQALVHFEGLVSGMGDVGTKIVGLVGNDEFWFTTWLDRETWTGYYSPDKRYDPQFLILTVVPMEEMFSMATGGASTERLDRTWVWDDYVPGVTAVPEPATLALVTTGGALVFGWRRRRK